MKAKQSDRKSCSTTKLRKQNSIASKSSRREFLKQAGYKCIGFAGLVFAANLSGRADACKPPPPECIAFYCPTDFTCSPVPSYPCIDNRCDTKNTCTGTAEPYFICYRGTGDGDVCGTLNDCITMFNCRRGHTCTGLNRCVTPGPFDCPPSSNTCTPTHDVGGD